MTDDRPTAPHLADIPRPAETPSVGLWGASGCGKTQFALSVCADLAHCPVVYVDIDGGRAAVRHYEHADLMVYRAATRVADVVRILGDVAAGKVCNRAGVPARTVVIDAVSSLLDMELRYVQGNAADQAKALAPVFRVLFGHLRELVTRHQIGVIEVCHSKPVTEKVGDLSVRSEVPAVFPSIREPWMAHLRHVWEVSKARGALGPAFPIMSLRTEARGRKGTPGYVPYMKTSNIAFAQWIAGQCGRAEEYTWDTGKVAPEDSPTLATLLQVAAELQLEQGRAIATSPAAARALAALEAAATQADPSPYPSAADDLPQEETATA